MVRVKNVGGDPGDEDLRRSPRLPADPKGKVTKKLATKKRKYLDVDIARAAIVVEAAERAERRGACSGVVIADQQLPPATREALEQVERRHGGPARTVMLVGWCVAIEESQPQGESQQQAPPAEQTQEGQQTEETEQAPQP